MKKIKLYRGIDNRLYLGNQTIKGVLNDTKKNKKSY